MYCNNKVKKRFFCVFVVFLLCFCCVLLISGECPNLSNRECLNFLTYGLVVVGGQIEVCNEVISERRWFLKVIKKYSSVVFNCAFFKYEPCRTVCRDSICDRVIHVGVCG